MNVTAESTLRILIPRRNSHDYLRHATRKLIRRAIAQIHAETRGTVRSSMRQAI
jgi:hypothetical protein